QTFGLVKRCQGAIEVTSELGGGSSFKLFFPQIHAEIAHVDESLNQPAPALLQEQIPSSSRSVITSETESEKSRTILVVDDEAELLEMLATLLESSGFNVLKATDAATAIKLSKTNPVDLLLSDVMMPDTNGFELAAQITQLYPAVKVQLMSGYVDKTLVHGEQAEHWYAEKLNKPVPLTTLLSRLHNLLGSN
ncbi:MAG TPA: response regulator, partial [Rheinheimera sp.]|nr:response regulator [Rheinheimera sp.]